MADKDYKDLVILAIAAIGITAAFCAYMIYIRSKDKKEQQSLTSMYPLGYQQQQPTIQYIYDDKIYQILDEQQKQLDNINANIDSLKIQSQSEVKQKHDIKIQSPSRAGSIITLKTQTEDKSRQKSFGMI